jgi:hypothetical protein
MTQELHYTSAPRGLRPGARGFGTVAATPNFPDLLAERLESFSGYQAVYPPGDPSAALNPIVYSHVRLAVAGRMFDVVSRIGPAGLDYSGRPNKYAHHVVLDPDEAPQGGPAWLLGQPGFLEASWSGEPRILPEGRIPPAGDVATCVANSWLALTGDAGWAGVLAEAFLADPKRPVFVVFRPGMDILRLFEEAIALLPEWRRWDVEFSTYFTTLPQGITCSWRGVLDNSAEARNARRLPNALVIDLCRPLGRALGGPLVNVARSGKRVEDSSSGIVSRTPLPHAASRRLAVTTGPAIPTAGATQRPRAGPRSGEDWLPDLAARLAVPDPLLHDQPRDRRWTSGTKARIAIVIAACLVPLVAAGLVAFTPILRHLGLQSPASRPNNTAEAPVKIIKVDTPTLQTPERDTRTPEKTTAAKEPAEKVAHQVLPVAKKPHEAAGPRDHNSIGMATPKAPHTPRAITETRAHREPVVVAFSIPDVPRSALDTRSGAPAELSLAEDVNERIEILNAPGLRLNPATATRPVQIERQPGGSSLPSSAPLAKLVRTSAHTWRFDWTQAAEQAHTLADSIKDAVLKLSSPDGKSIFVLMRGLVVSDRRPLPVLDGKPILFDTLEPRTKPVDWTRNSGALAHTHWKLSIHRWKVVISRSDPESDEFLSHAIEPGPEGAANQRGAGARTPLEHDVIPGEVTLNLDIDPTSPDTIVVRFIPKASRVRERRQKRAEQLKKLKDETPKDSKEQAQDPLRFRRDKLRKLDESTEKDDAAIETVRQEIRELEEIYRIRKLEDLLTKPGRTELSVAIGLDVGAANSLEIVKIGEFAGRH